MKRILTLIAILAITGLAHAVPQPLHPSPFGMDALKPRFGKDMPNIWEVEEELGNYLVDAGVRWDRANIDWSDVQTGKDGPFDWSFTDKMVEVYSKRPISGYCLLMGRGQWLAAEPHTDEERAEFAKYVYEVVSRYKNTFKVWEIWNEPNIPSFWTVPNAADYTLLLKAAFTAARKADPTCRIILGGTSTVDIGWIRQVLFANGGWDYCDAVAIHPYSMGGSPASQGLGELIRMTRAVAMKNGVPKPIWITEVGYTTNTQRDSELRQAEFIVQEYVIALTEGVRKVFWFTLGDWSERWGIIAGKKDQPDWGFTSTKRPKPAYYALKHLIEALSPNGGRPTYLGYLPDTGKVSAIAFLSDGLPKKPVLVVWAPFGVHEALELPRGAPLHALDARGKTVAIEDFVLHATEVPVIVTGFKSGALKAASPKNDMSLRRPGVNLVINPSMELPDGDDVSFWNHGRFPDESKDGKTEWATRGHSGARSLRIAEAKDAAWHNVPIPVWEGKTYTLRAWAKPDAATGTNNIAIVWYSGNMWTWLGQSASTEVAGAGGWRELTITGKAPADAMIARITITGKDNTGSVLWDDVTLTEGK
jgi:hypothetical protein